MGKFICDHPFDEYIGYGPRLHAKQLRNYVVLKNLKTKKIRCMSYARYLMQVSIGRFLSKSEHVDHIDNNKLNDVIENLQIISLSENNKKSAKAKGVRFGLFKCPNCGVEFQRRIGLSHIQQKTKKVDYCSKSCCMKSYYSGVQHNDSNLIKEFRKR